MKSVILSVFAVLAVMTCTAFTQAHAGWGAIVYNDSTGQVGYSNGWGDYDSAVNAAQNACAGVCRLVNWEHNRCNAFATGEGTTWGQSSGWSDSDDATNAAVNSCGPTCSWRAWVCN
jgi:hypothetical protein